MKEEDRVSSKARCRIILASSPEWLARKAAKDLDQPMQLRIIVVDDHPDAAEAVQLLLMRRGHHVVTANDGKTALKLVDEVNPDLVFVDIGMPNMNGYEVARMIRRFPGRESMRLVSMTGWGQLQDKQRSIDAGFNEHLIKPILPEQLEKLLET